MAFSTWESAEEALCSAAPSKHLAHPLNYIIHCPQHSNWNKKEPAVLLHLCGARLGTHRLLCDSYLLTGFGSKTKDGMDESENWNCLWLLLVSFHLLYTRTGFVIIVGWSWGCKLLACVEWDCSKSCLPRACMRSNLYSGQGYHAALSLTLT